MPYLVNRAAKKQIPDEPVTMTGHGDQITILRFGGSQYLRWRVSERQMALDR